ncbi:hypothetical protein [Actinocorallia herbida]|nr:hypothetical protein [Actinocorallia herbida]
MCDLARSLTATEDMVWTAAFTELRGYAFSDLLAGRVAEPKIRVARGRGLPTRGDATMNVGRRR